jgi:septal ring factor EnvC (AmiA/AmiB activator)
MSSVRDQVFGLRQIVAVAVAVSIGALFVLFAAGAQSSRNADEEAALREVRKQINALESRLARQSTQRDDSARALRDAELQIAAGARNLRKVRADLAEQQARQRSLGLEQRRAHQWLAAERQALSQQVRMSYITGREEIFKLLLSQESPASLGRMLVYYDYFNRARSVRIAAVSSQIRTLQRLDEEGDQVRAELATLEQAQSEEVAAIGRLRDERRALLATLDAGIADANSEIERLRSEERRLAELVKQLAELLAGFPVSSEESFARLKGRLTWPVQGKVAGDYGKPRGGGPMRWNGVLLEAAQGTAVRTVYHGRVAFADWLPGLGLLIIVDHGDGYMSLYGHNEALLKESGDWVEPGEAIAQVGDTGGQARPSLYFEIRQNGEPVNPHQWIAQKPAGR